MEQERKNFIFERLLAIRIKIDTSSIPSPSYINEKIGECHIAIEEVERFNIEISQNISVITQAYNSSSSDYEMKKQTLLTENKEILSFPNIKEREAKANSFLRKELETVKTLENEVKDLENILKVINLKIKNLNRINTDIKMQLRLLEAQIKLGSGPGSDVVTKSLMDEMSKGITNSDSFVNISSKEFIEESVDPTSILNVEDLINNNVEKENDESDEDELEKDLNPDIDEEWLNDVKNEDIESVIEEDKIIDLDKDLDLDNNEKSTEIQQNMSNQIKQEPIDIDDLLDLIQKKEC